MRNNWKKIKVKDFCEVGRGRVISGVEINNNLGIYPVFSSQTANDGEMGKINTYDFDGEYVTWTTDGAYAGTVFHRNGKFNCTNVCGTLKTKSNDFSTKFLAYKLSTVAKDYVSYVGNPKLMNNVMAEIELEIPLDSEEQTAIAEVLDKIDSAIKKTQKLIEKQKRIKQGLMQDLLTKGIDEHGNIRNEKTHRFKDSQLGKIPEEWRATSLKTALDFIDAGKSPTCLMRPAGAGEWGILKVSAVRPEGFRAKENKAIINKLFVNPLYEVKDGDLLISRANTYELVGIVCLVRNPPQQLMLSDKTLRLNINKNVANAEFIFHILQTPNIRSQIEVNATGSSGSMKNISQASIESFLVALPEVVEQERAIQLLNTFTKKIDILKKERHKLEMTKQGLMQDLLTGKKSVNNLISV